MNSPQLPHRVSNRRRIRLCIFIFTFAILATVIVGLAIALKNRAPEANLVWLDPARFARQIRPGPFKRLYYRALNFAAPVLQHFRRPKKTILVNSQILAVHGATVSQLGLGNPTGTNATGAQVWICPEFERTQRQLKTMKGVDVVNAPRIMVGDGTAASISCGNTYPKTGAFVGVTVDVAPKIVSHQLQLPMNVVYSELNGDSSANPIRTNLSAACRILVPNAGGILITSPEAQNRSGTNYWLILSAAAVDGLGKTIKL